MAMAIPVLRLQRNVHDVVTNDVSRDGLTTSISEIRSGNTSAGICTRRGTDFGAAVTTAEGSSIAAGILVVVGGVADDDFSGDGDGDVGIGTVVDTTTDGDGDEDGGCVVVSSGVVGIVGAVVVVMAVGGW